MANRFRLAGILTIIFSNAAFPAACTGRRYRQISSWPGLTRPSTPFSAAPHLRHVDARIKSGHDDVGGRCRRYCVGERWVGRMRVTTIFSRSRHSGTRGAILVFQWSLSYTAL